MKIKKLLMGIILVDILKEDEKNFGITKDGRKVPLDSCQNTLGSFTYGSECNLQRQVETFVAMGEGYLYLDRGKATKNHDRRSWNQPYTIYSD